MITYTVASNSEDLHQILELQKANVEEAISIDESKQQGFVTVHHDFELLQFMNQPHPHIIAKDGEIVVGYALIMLKSLKDRIPVLFSMFEEINNMIYRGEKLEEVAYFVMGQVCISKAYRGKGIFRGLYEEMKRQMSPHFKYVVTEIATRNTRSIRAHEKVGFKEIKIFSDEQEEWSIVLWDWEG